MLSSEFLEDIFFFHKTSPGAVLIQEKNYNKLVAELLLRASHMRHFRKCYALFKVIPQYCTLEYTL